MPHKILQCIWIHSCLDLIATIGMSAYMWFDIRHLHSVDVIVSTNHMVEPMLPMHRYKWLSIFIVGKESTIAIYQLFMLRSLSILDNSLEHFCNIICYRNLSLSGIHLCLFYKIFHITKSL